MERIILVEDTRFYAAIIRDLLHAPPDAEVTVAVDLAAARKALEAAEIPFSLAAVDLVLPDAPNGEAVDLTLAAEVPKIVMTGSFDEGLRQQFMDKSVLD